MTSQDMLVLLSTLFYLKAEKQEDKCENSTTAERLGSWSNTVAPTIAKLSTIHQTEEK